MEAATESHDSPALNDFARTSEARPGAGQASGTRILWRRRGVRRVRARTEPRKPGRLDYLLLDVDAPQR